MIRLSSFSSPLGTISVAECRGCVLAIEFGDRDALRRRNPRLLEWCSASQSPIEGESDGEPESLPPAAERVWQFLCGRTETLRVRVDLSLIDGAFDRKVLRQLFRSRPGQTMSYGELARAVGSPGAARAVGGVMRRNPLPIVIPCHRVVPSSGGLGNYTGGVSKKAWLLEREGGVVPAG